MNLRPAADKTAVMFAVATATITSIIATFLVK